MKSILLTSSSSSESSTSSSNLQTSNNLSLIGESHKSVAKEENIGDVDVLKETIFVETKLLNHGNIKKQGFLKNNKIVSKNDNHLKRGDKNIIECEEKWQNAGSEYSLSLENHSLINSNNVIINESENNSSKKLKSTVVTSGNSASTTTTKLINLRKKNGTTLIFQRKNYSQQSQIPATDCSEYQELEIESFKKRQSLNWPHRSNISSHTKSNKSRHYSWHDPCNYSTRSIAEEFESSVSRKINKTQNFTALCVLKEIHFLVTI